MRIFLEMGPGGSCARMIHKILEGMPFRARSISAPTQDEPSAVLRALAMLIAERVPVDLARLYPAVQDPEVESGPVIRVRSDRRASSSTRLLACLARIFENPRERSVTNAVIRPRHRVADGGCAVGAECGGPSS